jgi:hypothetical protein
MKRTRVSLVVMALAAGFSLSACGGASSAPTDASEEAFCDAQFSFIEDLMKSEEEPTEDEMAKIMHDWADELEKVGTPKDISDEAREGFELTVEQISDVEADDFKNDAEALEELEKDLSDKEKDQAEAYNNYVNETCGSPEMPDIELPDDPSSTE